MKNLFFAAAVLCIAGAATAMTTKSTAPLDRYVQTSAGVWQKITATYQPGIYCNEDLLPCSYQVPAGNTASHPATISQSYAQTNGFIADDEGVYEGPLN